MSKQDDIFNRLKKRNTKSAAEEFLDQMMEGVDQAIDETLERTNEENNVGIKEETKKKINEEKKKERKRVSFDLRIDLHKKFKMLAVDEDRNIYELIEEAMERFLEERN